MKNVPRHVDGELPLSIFCGGSHVGVSPRTFIFSLFLFFFGSCGIVLCSRDAKFAVDCDTCRLPYCLVCLASQTKEPCVRCGHRPSKRMEQLVHLRLKSIYKAFKQSSRSPKDSSCGNTLTIEELDDDDDDIEGTGAVTSDDEIFQAAAMAAASNSNDHFEEGALMNREGVLVNRGGNMNRGGNKDMFQKYMAEKKKADAAAEALLAELEEEEEAITKKKSKKKRKKERQQAKREEEQRKKDHQQEQKQNKQQPKQQNSNQHSKKRSSEIERRSSSPMPKEETETSTGEVTPSKDAQSQVSADTQASPQHDEKMEEPELKVDPMEKKLFDAVEDGDTDAIEAILFALKGVPGRAALRKNAKKALKRLRSNAEAEAAAKEEPEPVLARSGPPRPEIPTTTMPASELLKVVSDNNVGISNGKHQHSASIRAECVMQMSPVVIGWVIGKGGQRIRDLMEESGAKVWIDQEKIVKASDCRNVYVSGERKCVDHAVRMIKDIVSKAPVAGGGGDILTKPNTSSDPLERPQVQGAPPSSNQSKPVQQQHHIKQHHAGQPLTRKISTLLPAETDAPMEAPQSMSKTTATNNSVVEHVLPCEARFVPLLIGKRGWTIKQIQDDSGARIDIDQTVTPRQIRITGAKSQVEKATGSVLHVLSYKHAQSQQEQQQASTSEQPPEKQIVHGRNIDAQLERNHTPPPSSLIMTGDTKGLVSASSSLSSTPEPSLVFEAKGYSHAAQLHHGPLIPPPEYSANNPIQENGFMTQLERRAYDGPTPNYGAAAGLVGMHHQVPGMGMPPSHLQQQPQQSMYNHSSKGFANTHSMSQQPILASSFRPTGMPENGNDNLANSGPLDFGIMGRNNTAPGSVSPGAIPHPQQKAIKTAAPVPQTYHLQGNSLQNSVPGGNDFGANHSAYGGPADLARGAEGGGLWNAPKYAGAQPTSAVGNYLDSLGPASQPNRNQQRGSHGLDQAKNGLQRGRDDSQLIDSLFGPSGSIGDQQPSLLTGLSGLSLNPENGLGGRGFWGTSALSSDWDAAKEGARAEVQKKDLTEPTEPTTLMTGLPPPNLSASQGHHHPIQSRFNFNSTNA